MKRILAFLLIIWCFAALNKVMSQDIIRNGSVLESYINNEVTLCGKILHVCPVNSDKMKLQLADGQIVVVRLEKHKIKFDHNNTGKEVEIRGILHQQKLEKTEINSNYEQQN